jgi:hypothetical protein
LIFILLNFCMVENQDIKRQGRTVSEKFIDQLYQLDISFTDQDGNRIDIPENGFLGLLAAGYKGTVALRKRRGQSHLYAKYTKK